jgi:4-hydroxy-2-oxoheptanedioate aldolase
MSIGLAGQTSHPAVIEAREHTARIALKYGVRPRAEINDVKEVEYYLKLGVKDFNISTDAAILNRFYNEQGGALREMLSKV